VRLLLDTHAFLAWNRSGGSTLSDLARSLIEDPENEILFSVASAWEIAIKASRGRLVLPGTPARWVPDRVRRHGFVSVPILLEHALRAGALPRIHDDPFDRVLIAQARSCDVAIVTSDPLISRYDVETVW
jgi:PIN domain nuclease of toxin-antitoxin system